MGAKTKIVSCRSWPMEFAVSSEAVAGPPWYVIHMRGGTFSLKGWYWWHDYMGPPMVFLTRKRANDRAKELREQFGGGDRYGNGPLKVTVVKMLATGKAK